MHHPRAYSRGCHLLVDGFELLARLVLCARKAWYPQEMRVCVSKALGSSSSTPGAQKWTTTCSCCSITRSKLSACKFNSGSAVAHASTSRRTSTLGWRLTLHSMRRRDTKITTPQRKSSALSCFSKRLRRRCSRAGAAAVHGDATALAWAAAPPSAPRSRASGTPTRREGGSKLTRSIQLHPARTAVSLPMDYIAPRVSGSGQTLPPLFVYGTEQPRQRRGRRVTVRRE